MRASIDDDGILELADCDHERGRIASIEITILRRIGTFVRTPTKSGSVYRFRPDRTSEVRDVLRSFCVDVGESISDEARSYALDERDLENGDVR